MTSATVVIPAHNEARVIARCLGALLDTALPGEFEVIVVCNGCHDDTAALARAIAPHAIVLELDAASKAAALNAGDAVASTFPRLYVDADVQLTTEAARATITALREGALCAAPVAHHDVSGRPWLVRCFYAVHERIPFFTGPGAVGNGVYGLSAEGRSRFDRFPDITADDQYVLERFTPEERHTIPSERFTIQTPRTLRGVVTIRTRSYRGNLELHAMERPDVAEERVGVSTLASLLRKPRGALGVPVWVAVNVVAKVQARRSWDGAWERDDTSRSP
jgi:glycosyltransferase involved in cell wall biosynthesis